MHLCPPFINTEAETGSTAACKQSMKLHHFSFAPIYSKGHKQKNLLQITSSPCPVTAAVITNQLQHAKSLNVLFTKSKCYLTFTVPSEDALII